MTPEQFKRKVNLFNQELFNKRFNRKLGELIRGMIYKRTKSGMMLSGDTSNPERTRLKKMKPLSESYVMRRNGVVEFRTHEGKLVRFKIQKPKLGPYGSPRRSNLTFTGQMLEALTSEVSRNLIRVFVAPTSRTDTGYRNSDIAEIVQKDRPFMGLAESEFRVVIREIERHVNQMVLKYFS